MSYPLTILPLGHPSVVAEELLQLDLDEMPAPINDAVGEAQRHAGAAVGAAVLAGALLRKAKDMVPHGQWEAWLREHCTVAPRTAQAYMRLSAKVSEMPLEKRNAVAELPLREAFKAISTSPTPPPSYSRDRTNHDLGKVRPMFESGATVMRNLARDLGFRRIKLDRIRNARAQLLEIVAELDRMSTEAAA